MAFPQHFKTYQAWLIIAVVSLVLFLESAIPYIYAERHAPSGYQFMGQVAYTPDQNMYFSFISQARDGDFVLYNKLTATPNKPVFINLEFAGIGLIQHISGLSENGIYQLWRYLGVLLLTAGVYMLAVIILRKPVRVLFAMLLALFAGGFGFIFASLSAAHLIDFNTTQLGIIDMRYGLLPFQQMLTNPHFSFPHGLILIAYGCFLLAERDDNTRYYIYSGIIFTIIGLVRPYDLIPPVIIFPLYLLISTRPFKFDIPLLAKRLLPLFIIIPVFLYNIWLFKFNDIFKYWGQQGLNAGSLPSPMWHYLAFGITGILAIARLLQAKNNPLGKWDRFLLIWFGVTFIFIHLGRYIPALGWSPQIGVYLAVPLALLAGSIRLPSATSMRYSVPGSVILIALISNAAIVMYFTRSFDDGIKRSVFYAHNEEMAAWQWLKANTTKGQVVLATTNTSARIAKYTGASVVAGHYSVTPKFIETEALVNSFFYMAVAGLAQQPLLTRLNADYLYIGPAEKQMNNITISQSAYLTQVYANPMVTIYKVNKN